MPKLPQIASHTTLSNLIIQKKGIRIFTPHLSLGKNAWHDETKGKGKNRIPSARKVGWDYSLASCGFIPINAHAQSPMCGVHCDGEMFRNDLGESVARNWVLTLDE